MHMSEVVAALEVDSAIFDVLSLPYVRIFLSSHVEVYLTLPPLRTKTNLFGRLQNVIALISLVVI